MNCLSSKVSARESPTGDNGISRSPAEAYEGKTPRDRSVVDHHKPIYETESAFDRDNSETDLASLKNADKTCTEINTKTQSTSPDVTRDADDNMTVQADDNMTVQADDNMTVQADDKLQREDDIRMKEIKRKDILINMKLVQTLQSDVNIGEDILTAESVIMQEFKHVFDEHVKDKEKFDKMIENREQDLSEQLREMDKLLESLNEERSEIEKVIGEFADTQKKHTHFKHEVTRIRVEHVQQAISREILFQDNAEIHVEARKLHDEMKKVNVKGLNELNKETHDSKCAAGILKDKNDKFETEIKSKVEEFNKLKIEVMDKGITYMTKRKPVQVETISGFPSAKRSMSPPIGIGSSDDSSPKLLRDKYEDKLLSMAESKIHHIFERVRDCKSLGEDKSLFGQADVSGIEKIDEQCIEKTDENMEVDLKKKVHFENEKCTALDIPNVNGIQSRIPRPIVQPYGSASRYGERFLVTKSNSLAVIESDKYKRDNFVPDVEKHVTKPTMNYINTEIELQKLKGRGDIGNGNERFGPLYQRERKEASHFEMEHKQPKINKRDIKSKIDTGLSTTVARRGAIKDGTPPKRIVTAKETNKNKIIPRPPKTKKTAIKSKIDTGLGNGSRKVANIKNGQNNARQREVIRTGQKESGNHDKAKLPPLKHVAKTEKDLLPKSSRSFDEKVPLPEIKQSHLRMNGNTTPLQSLDNSHEYEISRKDPLPPIASGDNNIQRLSPRLNDGAPRSAIDKLQPLPVNASEQSKHLQQTTTDTQKPESLRLSFTPTPPSTPCTNRRRKRSARGQNSPDENDSSRVPTERA